MLFKLNCMDVRMKIPKNIQDRIYEMTKSDLTYSDIARTLGVSRCSVFKYRYVKNRKKYSDTFKSEVLSHVRNNTMTRGEIAKRYDIAPSTLYRWCKEDNIPPSFDRYIRVPEDPIKRNIMVKELLDLADTGLTYREIAEKTNIPIHTVTRLLQHKFDFIKKLPCKDIVAEAASGTPIPVLCEKWGLTKEQFQVALRAGGMQVKELKAHLLKNKFMQVSQLLSEGLPLNTALTNAGLDLKTYYRIRSSG